ncbi:MAG: alpha-amylase [Elusimicrobia bacterium]|nr:alpha-amylase [Elusimicrobiota bacterium]
MRLDKILLAAILAISFAQNSRAQGGTSAGDELKAQAGKTAIATPAPPEPSAEPAGLARQDWLTASQLYSDNAFTVKQTPRIDSGPNYMIMLQGFHWYADNYWYHPPGGWWGALAGKAAEIGKAGFGLIWFPPVSVGSYYPTEWYKLDSQWGKKNELVGAVKAMHSAGVLVLGDVVLNHRNGSKNWADFTNPDWPTTAIVKDDEWSGSPKSPNYDEGQGDSGCRDLDHRNTLVQQDAKIFMRWLRNTIGFDGWRFDMVKGFTPSHIKDYNAASSPLFTVGEVYDGNRQVVTNWIDGTDDSPQKANASSAFDFPTRFNLIFAVENERYEFLNDGGKPSGVIGWWPVKSVTFVENHDTSPRDPNFIANASAEYKTQRLMGYAYILTHPGLPCVFWPHFFDWGRDYRDRILALMNIRRKAGVSSVSPVRIIAATNELYAAIITGRDQRVALKLGRNWGWNPGNGWTLAATGDRYAVWTQSVNR